MVRHQQRAAAGGNSVDAVDLVPEVPFEEGSSLRDDLLDEFLLPIGYFVIRAQVAGCDHRCVPRIPCEQPHLGSRFGVPMGSLMLM